ncbi:MAG: Hpt domain-containing protein, partial [Planctomycetaceae bacterium]|nr:Hpt domain-containing protein [Planctomycetaceae bacterium]
REHCLASDFDGYLAKPIRRAELRAVFEALDPGRPGPDGRSEPLLDSLNEICGGDADFVHELDASFLESAARCLAGIALALQAGEPSGIPVEAHGLNGINRTIEAEELASTCRALEESGSRGDLDGAQDADGPIRAAWERARAVLEHHPGTITCKVLIAEGLHCARAQRARSPQS